MSLDDIGESYIRKCIIKYYGLLRKWRLINVKWTWSLPYHDQNKN